MSTRQTADVVELTIVHSCTECPKGQGAFCKALGIYVKHEVDTHTIHVMCPFLRQEQDARK